MCDYFGFMLVGGLLLGAGAWELKEWIVRKIIEKKTKKRGVLNIPMNNNRIHF